MLTLSPTVVTLLLTTGLLLGLTGMAWRFREQPGAEAFGALQALSGAWAGLTVVGLSLPPGPARLRVWGVTNGVSLLVIALWFVFIVSYTGREKWLTWRRLGVLSLPLAVGTSLYTVVPSWSPLVGDLTQDLITAGTVVEASIGPIGGVLGVYIYLVFSLGLGMVGKTLLEGNSLFAGQELAFGLGSTVSIGASVLAIVGVPGGGYPTTQVAVGGQTLLWGYAVFGQQFLQTVPAVATIGERSVLDDIDEGVLVVDSAGTVIRANSRARAYLDLSGTVGGSVSPVLDCMGVATTADLPTRFESQGRTYRVKASPVTDWREETIGRALVIQDVTPLVRHQQRLQVLNRVLRHNVRNEMNVVLGVGNQLQRESDEALVEMGETLVERASSMTGIAEKAIEFDRVLEDSQRVEQVDLEATVEQVVSQHAAAHPDATLTSNVSVDEVRTSPRILSLVLEELVANALEHAGQGPEVTVGVQRADGQVQVSVTDDGPGIPSAETDPITSGEETDLEHTSSLGLWLVSWGAQSLGGDLDITTTGTGSVVTVVVPDRASETDPDDAPRPPGDTQRRGHSHARQGPGRT